MPRKNTEIPERMSITRSDAIRYQCIECMGFQPKSVRACTDQACALWPYRLGPGQTQQTEAVMRHFDPKWQNV